MKTKILAFFTAVCCSLSTQVQGVDITDKATGEVFPSEVSFDFNGKQYDLEATGVATRKKLIISVYSVASYLQKGAKSSGDKFEQILGSDTAKQLTLKWVRTVEAAKVQEGYKESFKNALTPDAEAQVKAEIDQFIAFFSSEVKKGDEQVLRFIPGGTVEVLINGKTVGQIKNEAFAKGLWNIWFGQKSVVDRNKLVALMK